MRLANHSMGVGTSAEGPSCLCLLDHTDQDLRGVVTTSRAAVATGRGAGTVRVPRRAAVATGRGAGSLCVTDHFGSQWSWEH